jgi:hypothetical protein
LGAASGFLGNFAIEKTLLGDEGIKSSDYIYRIPENELLLKLKQLRRTFVINLGESGNSRFAAQAVRFLWVRSGNVYRDGKLERP